MITNCRPVALVLFGSALAAAGCASRGTEDSDAAQGIVEYEQRVLGFERAGRVTEIPVMRGDRVKKGQRLARLDDELARTTRSVRANEERAARAQLALLESGAKPEDIRSVAARVKAA